MYTIGERVSDAEAPFTNRVFRIGVLGVVGVIFAAVCFGVVLLDRQSREASRRNRCSNNLKQIALSLQNYYMAHHALPPAYLTDKTGKPVLSWRVAAAPYCLYRSDFSKSMDFDQASNSPKNAKFLSSVRSGSFIHCPSSGKKPESPLTDYVAVVGPDTLWPGKVPGDLQKHPKGILVVEWPESDINWAEPRDITVEEFIISFRQEPASPQFPGLAAREATGTRQLPPRLSALRRCQRQRRRTAKRY